VPENLELELHKQFSASREKYIYFLLAAQPLPLAMQWLNPK